MGFRRSIKLSHYTAANISHKSSSISVFSWWWELTEWYKRHEVSTSFQKNNRSYKHMNRRKLSHNTWLTNLLGMAKYYHKYSRVNLWLNVSPTKLIQKRYQWALATQLNQLEIVLIFSALLNIDWSNNLIYTVYFALFRKRNVRWHAYYWKVFSSRLQSFFRCSIWCNVKFLISTINL